MTIKSSKTQVEEAMKQIDTIDASEVLKMSNDDKCTLIDIRDANELQQTGKIKNSINISRGLLEFSMHPESAYVQNNNIDLSKDIVLFCAAGGRSALAAKTLKEMGYEKVSHIDGGFKLMVNSGFKVEK